MLEQSCKRRERQRQRNSIERGHSMFTSLKVRISIILIVCFTALFFLIPTFIPNIPSPWNKYLPKEKIHLGLDLQGGMHLVLEVDTQKAMESMMERLSENLKESLMDNRIRFRNLKTTQNGMISLELTESAAKTDLEKILRSDYQDPERAKNLIGKTALLEFKLVDDEHSLEDALRGNVPDGSMIAYGLRADRSSGQRGSVPYLLK